ncbi:HAD family hydrolase [Herbiconiux sp. VKM Ac-1786]|uniref:HAD family hydrolase n=1 Tax=Herbiconiux sp. VKM Ac-1786 TaxID=2783824 RepID=UPI00188CB27A|nr:HAD family hydrolase [Herbiconiux sp. VKM Ac-1786]MBF4571497.1 HAD family hydrolase [Herbiconiux sp. VKM Ac-1786]
MPIPERAVLFDVDGTLVDSNYLHVSAWLHAFVEVGHPVPAWRIHQALGMDSGKLLDELLGDATDELGDRAKELHATYYKESADQLRPLPGARELLRALHEEGRTIVLATSAPADELEILQKVLDADEWVDAMTNADDVETAKPEPDILQVALERAGVEASDAVMVGDARWDMVAAGRSGIRGIGLLSGGVDRQALIDAGATETYDDAEALRAAL